MEAQIVICLWGRWQIAWVGRLDIDMSGVYIHFKFGVLWKVRFWFMEFWYDKMKIKNSLKSLKGRHRANRIVRRRGRVYVINKQNPRFKARQG